MQPTVLSQIAIQLVCVHAINIALCKHGELSVVALTDEFFYFKIGTWLLRSELVAREGQDLETLVSKLQVQIRDELVVHMRIASPSGHIDEHDSFFV